MNAEFVSLADLLRPPVAASAAPVSAVAVTDHDDGRDAGSPQEFPVAPPGVPGVASALRDARLFRARLADALDLAAARLVRELAADVLMRELRVAPCDVAALVERVRDRGPVVRVRVAAADVGCVRGVPVVVDSALEPGDAVVELAGGSLDVRLGVRLAAVLEAFA